VYHTPTLSDKADEGDRPFSLPPSPGFGPRLAAFALDRASIILFVVVVLGIAGVVAYLSTPKAIFPTMTFSRIEVAIEAGDLPPEQVRVAVTRPLELAFGTLARVTSVRATSEQGAADITIEFDPATPPQADLQLVNQAIATVRPAIPAAKSIVAVAVAPNNEPVVSYALTSPTLSQAVIRQIALQTIVPNLTGITGVSRVVVTGGPATEFRVILDAATLSAHGLTAADVEKAIADTTNVQSVGTATRYYRRYVLLVDAAVRDARTLGAVTVVDKSGAPIPIASLGSVSLGVSPPTDAVSFDGKHCVLISMYALVGADAIAAKTAFAERLASVTKRLPRDISVGSYWDQTTLVVDSQNGLRDAILIGAVLAVIVIFAFLRNLRLTLVAAAIIPFAMTIAIFVMSRLGETLNLMSVGGLAVAVGLIIDDAIVVIENVARRLRLEPHRPKRETVTNAVGEMVVPMLASTSTTIVVFLPLLLLTGVAGFFFRALALTLASALVVSLLLAILVGPILANAFLRQPHEGEEERDPTARIALRYERLLHWSLSHRVPVYVGAVGVLIATVLLLLRLPSEFLPQMDEGQFEISYRMPTGTSLAATDAAATAIESVLMRDPAVKHEGRLTGLDSNGISPLALNRGAIRITMVPRNKRDGFDEVSSRLRDKIKDVVPAAQLDFHQILEDAINDLSGTPAPIEIVVRGADQNTLIAYAGKIGDAIGKITGVVDASPGVIYEDPTITIAPSAARLAQLGAGSSDLSDALSAGTQGVVATQLTLPTAQVPVRVQVGQDTTTGLDTSLPVVTKGGTSSLGSLAATHLDSLSSVINEENSVRVLRVTANIEGASLSSVTSKIADALKSIPRPPGYTATIGGASAVQAQSFKEFITTILVATMLVFAVMLTTFNSFRTPLTILTAIPLALVGVALGLFITRTPVNVSSFMGLLLLIGIVVKNGILLVDVANTRIAAGDDMETALLTAGRTRLRPILMTTLAAIGGLFPLALALGSGTEMERPLAIAVIGGLSTATLFTLVLIPVLYAAFVPKKKHA